VRAGRNVLELRFNESEQEFAEEVRKFIRANLPPSTQGKLIDGRSPDREEVILWHRILNQKGWAVPHWPEEWGGTNWDPVRRYILRYELENAPALLPVSTNTMFVGPVIIAFGNDEQKRRFLPRIANLDDWWCQGFSEPGAGSDLASLKTVARRDSDCYVVSGQKIWTTYAQHADWIFALVRTDPAAKKQAGISFLLIDMRSPGIRIRPIITIDGSHEVNEVFFDEVRVPVENRVGDENRGWDCAKFLLSYERTGGARVGTSRERLRRLKALGSTELNGTKPLMQSHGFAARVAAVEVQLKAHEITTLRVLAAEAGKRSREYDPMSSLLKIRGSEIQQAISELYLELAASGGLASTAVQNKGWQSEAAPTYFNWRKLSIYSGSNEIQRNILAKAVLGL
jgi:alkylation response protein AidB-like acyl-CoA dehydrogenase